MKSRKPVGILAIVLGVISLFLGIVIVSIALGSILPAINKISAPIVCTGDRVEIERAASNPRPGETFISLVISCVDKQTGVRQVKTFPMILASGVIYSLVIFVISMIWFINHPDSWGTYESEPADVSKGRGKKKS
jgi:hypothetical protein